MTNLHIITVNENNLNYAVIHTKRKKTLSITIYKDLSIKVRAPINCPESNIKEFIKKKVPWIETKLSKLKIAQQQRQVKRYVQGEMHYHIGKLYQLYIKTGTENHVKLKDNYLVIISKFPNNELYTKKLLTDWQWEQAKNIFKEVGSTIYQKFEDYKGKNPLILTANMRSRWGQCSSLGVIKINKELIKTPLVCVEYVLWHEFCHLLIKNHSKSFYSLLYKYCPNWKQTKKILNQFATFNLD